MRSRGQENRESGRAPPGCPRRPGVPWRARRRSWRLAGTCSHSLVRHSVVKVEAVQAGSGQPLMSPCSQVHREVDVAPQCSEPSGMETANGGDVASHGPDGQVLVTTGTGFLDNPADEHAANALIPRCLGDDDRLDFPARAPVEQTGQTDDPAARLGHPGSHPLRLGEVVIESRSRIVSADRRVPVDTPVVVRQLCPQGSTSTVVALGILANDGLRRSWRAWLPRNRHGLMLPGAPHAGVRLPTWLRDRHRDDAEAGWLSPVRPPAADL